VTADTPVAAVTYIGLPISSGGAHSLGNMSRRVAYERSMSFLRTCTQTDRPISYSFSLNDVPELPRPARLERELQRRFGHYSMIPAERVGDALDFLDEIHPQPTNRWGMAPIWFWASSSFRILDSATGQPLPAQDPVRFGGVEYEFGVPLGSSGLRLILENHAKLGIELCIPYPDEALLRRVVPWLQRCLPCKLSPRQWRAWTPTKTGSFKGRKMVAPRTSSEPSIEAEPERRGNAPADPCAD
jgi:hypothetical protein